METQSIIFSGRADAKAYFESVGAWEEGRACKLLIDFDHKFEVSELFFASQESLELMFDQADTAYNFINNHLTEYLNDRIRKSVNTATLCYSVHDGIEVRVTVI